ncbi:prostasin-like [Dendropsophus ebraccatus]|uniref:prostasin-like n=1 Tax=Dendropsophus ebraccatus TaxID=150705 RepID=UPI00383216A7
MGANVAPTYANLVVTFLEERYVYGSHQFQHVLVWWRFIDDVFLIWTGGESDLFSPSVSYNTTWSPPVCGVPVVSGQAAEGTDALDGQWPWQVSVWYSGSHICGGSLISSQWVLSAAHCFINSDKPQHYSIHLGRDHLTAGDNLTAQVSDIIRHPQYTDPGGRGDIALLKLSSPVTYTPDILPICLPPAAATFPCGMEGWVTGWGNTSIQGLLQAQDPIRSITKDFLKHETPCVPSQGLINLVSYSDQAGVRNVENIHESVTLSLNARVLGLVVMTEKHMKTQMKDGKW